MQQGRGMNHNIERKFVGMVCVLVLALFSLPLDGHCATSSGQLPRIGVLQRGGGPNARDGAFRQGLRALGWIEGTRPGRGRRVALQAARLR